MTIESLAGALRVERHPYPTPGWGPRSEWLPGPWDSEPDLVEWRHNGAACLIVRGGSGSLCGYVGLPPTHKYWGRDYDAVQEQDAAHGGLTYAGECGGRICHVPQPGEIHDVWWVGFDCSHAYDLAPCLQATLHRYGPPRSSLLDGTYRDLEYVITCVEGLADELATVGAITGREHWWHPVLAGAKLFLRRDLPRYWREIYLERDRYGLTREQRALFMGSDE